MKKAGMLFLMLIGIWMGSLCGAAGEEMYESEADTRETTESELDTDETAEGEAQAPDRTETETEENTVKIMLSDLRVLESCRYYDGTTEVKVEARVTGLPEGAVCRLTGEAQQADAGNWPVRIDVEVEGCDRYELEIQEEEKLTVTILPRPLYLTIGNARKVYYSENVTENLIFEETPLQVSGFLSCDSPDGSMPDGFVFPELEIDPSVLQKESPMYRDGKEIRYQSAVRLKTEKDGSISGNPTKNYTFFMEGNENIEGGDVILCAAPMEENREYSVQGTDRNTMWMDEQGIRWVKKGSGIRIVPEGNCGFSEGTYIGPVYVDGTAELTLTQRNEAGEITAESQIRSVSWSVDGEAPTGDWQLGETVLREGTTSYSREAVSIACRNIQETGSGIKKVELYAAWEDEAEQTGETLYETKRGYWTADEVLRLDREGNCRVWTRLEDQVGNVRYQCTGRIVLDFTEPEIQFSGILPGSANRQEAAPLCTVRDAHMENENVQVTLMGYHNGICPVQWKKEAETGELHLQMQDLPRLQKWDDVYTLRAEATDLAGNYSSREIRFSVNRFGSVYYTGEETQAQIKQFYLSDPKDMDLYEVNVDHLTESAIVLGYEGETRRLKKGMDYTVQKTGDDRTWKEYHYRISADCFEKEGWYYILCTSRDRAENVSDNRIRKEKIEFAVDRSAPEIFLTGLEDGEICQEEEKMIEIECRDQLALGEIEVFLNGKKVQQVKKEKLQILLQQKKEWQSLRITVDDKAGNRLDTGEIWFWLCKEETVPKSEIPDRKQKENTVQSDWAKQKEQINRAQEEKKKELSDDSEKNLPTRDTYHMEGWKNLAECAAAAVLLISFLKAKRHK